MKVSVSEKADSYSHKPGFLKQCHLWKKRQVVKKKPFVQHLYHVSSLHATLNGHLSHDKGHRDNVYELIQYIHKAATNIV